MINDQLEIDINKKRLENFSGLFLIKILWIVFLTL